MNEFSGLVLVMALGLIALAVRSWRKLHLLALWFRVFRGRGRSAQFANIGEGTFDHGIRSYLPDASTTARYLMYKVGSDTDHCALAGAGDTPIGPSDDQADVTNLVPIAVQVLGAVRGTVLVTTDGSLNDGSYVTTAANGQVTLATTGNLVIGKALIPTDAAKSAGSVISMIPTMPAKYSF